MKEGEIFINNNRNNSANPFAARTWPERVLDKHIIGDFTNKAFIQKGFNSNLEIPGYSNPDMNGKGYSFNNLPAER